MLVKIVIVTRQTDSLPKYICIFMCMCVYGEGKRKTWFSVLYRQYAISSQSLKLLPRAGKNRFFTWKMHTHAIWFASHGGRWAYQYSELPNLAHEDTKLNWSSRETMSNVFV